MTISTEKNIYIAADDADIKYANVYANENLDACNILKHACVYNIDVNLGQGLFKSARIENLHECYHNNWLYYASFSPIWLERILKFNGRICNKRVVFDEDEDDEDCDEDEFNEKYYYDTDEQSLETQEKNIQKIAKQSCELFYRKYQTINLDDYLSEIEYFVL